MTALTDKSIRLAITCNAVKRAILLVTIGLILYYVLSVVLFMIFMQSWNTANTGEHVFIERSDIVALHSDGLFVDRIAIYHDLYEFNSSLQRFEVIADWKAPGLPVVSVAHQSRTALSRELENTNFDTSYSVTIYEIGWPLRGFYCVRKVPYGEEPYFLNGIDVFGGSVVFPFGIILHRFMIGCAIWSMISYVIIKLFI